MKKNGVWPLLLVSLTVAFMSCGGDEPEDLTSVPIDPTPSQQGNGNNNNQGSEDHSIRVITGNMQDATYSGATLLGEVVGVTDQIEVGVIYSKSNDLSEHSGKKASTSSNGEFSIDLSGLFDGMTYYYCAYALYNGGYYLGETKSFMTPSYSYRKDGNTYRMVLVEGGDMPPFCIMQTEVTNDKVDVNHDNAVTKAEFRKFLDDLRAETGLPLRLPTKEEWQYAARGGNRGFGYKYSGSDEINDVAWYIGNSSREPHPVGSKQPNELGLYDMSGNYAELVNDKSDIYFVDGAAFGGSFKDSASKCTPNSYVTGLVTGLVAGSKSVREQNAYDASYISFRLVYSSEE